MTSKGTGSQAAAPAPAAAPEESGLYRPDELLQKLFERQTGDWKLIGCDGKSFNFHQDILWEQVPRFKALFSHEGTTETVLKEIKTPPELDMTGPAVEAFLRYVYYKDLQFIRDSSFAVVSSLIRAGHYYNLPKLVKDLADMAKVKRPGKLEWFSGEELFKLYQSVWLWEQDHPSKKKVINFIYNAFKSYSLSGNERKNNELLPIVGGNVVAGELMLSLIVGDKRGKGKKQPKPKEQAQSKSKVVGIDRRPVVPPPRVQDADDCDDQNDESYDSGSEW